MKGRSLLSKTLLIVMVLAVGVQVASAQEEESPSLGFDFEQSEPGVLVTDMFADSPAAMFGLQAGDVITAVDGKRVTADTFEEVLEGYSADNQITLTLLREGEEIEISLPLNTIPHPETSNAATWLQQIEQIPFQQRLANIFNPQNLINQPGSLADWNWSGEIGEIDVPEFLQPFANLLDHIFTTKPTAFLGKMLPEPA